MRPKMSYDVHIEIHPQRAPSRKRSSTHAKIVDVADLPPLPEPDVYTQRAEACRGCTLVLCVAGLLVALPHLIGRGAPSETLPWGWFGCLYALALVALSCLLGLLCGDPGTLKRSEEDCFPLPASVLKRLQARQSLDGMQNVRSKERGVFCVRCCIWRPEGSEDHVHHCSVCQRCVVLHDHHCGVFGRCIAGRMVSCRGSMRFYSALWLCAALGAVACAIACVLCAQP